MTQTLLKTIADFNTTLVTKVAVGDTTATLTTATDDDGVAIPTGTYAFTIDRNNSSKEHFSATLTGTALTNVKTLARGTSTGTAGFARIHRKGAEVIISDFAAIKRITDVLDGTTYLDAGTPLRYDGTMTPSNANELATKSYVDSTATGTTTIDRVLATGNGGEVISAGNLIYLKVSDGEWYKCDADTASIVDNVILGIAQGAGTDGGAINGGILLKGLDSNQSGLTANTAYYASNTAGGISSTPGTTEVSVGVSRSTTTLLFYPRYNQQLTENEQDLLGLMVLGTDFYGASSGGTDTYAITVVPTPAYTNGIRFRFKADVANTGAASLNVNGLGAIDIKKAHDQDLATGDIEANQIVEVVYNSTGPVFEMVSQVAVINTTDVQTFTANGTWTKPSGAKSVLVQAWGGGGAGGFGDGGGTGIGGGGGGGGAYKQWTFAAADLSATEAVVVGAGGTGGSGNGPAGSNSTFGSTKVIAYGGGGGSGNSSTAGGGGGGGIASIGTSSTSNAGGAGGDIAGGAGGSAAVGGASSFGGGGGGGGSNTGYAGGLSVFGGGGGGGGSNNTGAPAAGAVGGLSYYGGGGGAGGSSTAGAVAGGTSIYGGAGGTSTYAAVGANGSIPSGGGAGGSEGFNGGSGARGQVVVTTYL